MSKLRGWIPNLFTLANLTFGFLAILLCFQSRGNPGILSMAGGMILLAVLCDGLDGFAARLLNASSELGAQLDSLADLTAFGIAPGALMYSLVLHNYTLPLSPDVNFPIGMLIASVFPICAAYRLARFNVQHISDSFSGLPSPVAGSIVGLMPLISGDILNIPDWVFALIFVLSAFLMVSTVKYSKPQVSRRFTPVRLGILMVFLILALIFIGIKYNFTYSFMGIFFISFIYIVSGLVSLIIQLIQKYRM